jgi:hypothetical protein
MRGVFDSFGLLQAPSLGRVRRLLPAGMPTDAVVDYAVRNLGCVAVSAPRGRVTIRFRPHAVDPRALIEALYWLTDERPAQVHLVVYDREGAERDVVAGPWPRGVEVLNALLRDAGQYDAPSVITAPLAVDELSSDCPLRAALAYWTSSPRSAAALADRALLTRVLADRYVIVETAGGTENLRLNAIGNRMPSFALTSLRGAVGRHLVTHVDVVYGRTISTTYAHALANGQPRLERVDALASWQGIGRLRRRYRRLLLPFTAEGARLLLSATISDPSIDLRVSAG